MLPGFLQSVLVVVVGFALQAGLAAIGVELAADVFNAIVAGIVTWILAKVGLEGARRLLVDTRFAFKAE